VSARRVLCPAVVLACAALVSVGARPTLAKPKKMKKEECISASEDGQLLKVKGQLIAAREKLVLCADRSCPGALRRDCEAGLEELERITPSIVLGAKDATGRDLTDVSVSMDGALLVEELDGKAVAVDPGKHVFRFEAEGLPPHEEKIVVREGQKERIVLVTIGKKEPKPSKPPPKPEPKRAGPSTATWVVGGLGAAALAGAGVVGFVALQNRSSLHDRCGKAGTCSQDEVDSVYRLYDISYVAAGIGGALLVTSGVLYFTTSAPEAPEQGSVSIAPALGGAALWGRF
jgi:hypothetical protein